MDSYTLRATRKEGEATLTASAKLYRSTSHKFDDGSTGQVYELIGEFNARVFKPSELTGPRQIKRAGGPTVVGRYVVRAPVGTDIRIGDQIEIAGERLEVLDLNDGEQNRTENTLLRIFCRKERT